MVKAVKGKNQTLKNRRTIIPFPKGQHLFLKDGGLFKKHHGVLKKHRGV